MSNDKIAAKNLQIQILLARRIMEPRLCLDRFTPGFPEAPDNQQGAAKKAVAFPDFGLPVVLV